MWTRGVDPGSRGTNAEAEAEAEEWESAYRIALPRDKQQPTIMLRHQAEDTGLARCALSRKRA